MLPSVCCDLFPAKQKQQHDIRVNDRGQFAREGIRSALFFYCKSESGLESNAAGGQRGAGRGQPRT